MICTACGHFLSHQIDVGGNGNRWCDIDGARLGFICPSLTTYYHQPVSVEILVSNLRMIESELR